MMSLSGLRTNLFKTFELMRDARAEIRVYHRRKVYKLTIQETGEHVTTPYKNRGKSSRVPEALIDTKPCLKCDSLLVNGLCLNKSCETNKKP